MKYLSLILAILFMACSSESTQNTEVVEETAPVTETVTEPEIRTVIETVYINESEIDNSNEVKQAFLGMIETVNNAQPGDIDKIVAFIDSDYVFKGRNKDENQARGAEQLEKFQTVYSDVRVEGIGSSCDLAYVIGSFKKSIIERATGETRVDAQDKVGLFIMRKGADGKWRLLVQKTDDGFAHWFYMPESN